MGVWGFGWRVERLWVVEVLEFHAGKIIAGKFTLDGASIRECWCTLQFRRGIQGSCYQSYLIEEKHHRSCDVGGYRAAEFISYLDTNEMSNMPGGTLTTEPRPPI